MTHKQFAPIGLILGCIIFGLGSVIVAHLALGSYAVAFWRLFVAAIIFVILARVFAQKFPKNNHARQFALLSGGLLGLDLSLWHESIHAVGPGISTVLNCLQIFWLTAIGIVFFKEKLSLGQMMSLFLAILGVALIASPELGYNQHALWGLISGILSGLMLSLSMVCIRKVHQTVHTPIFPLMFYVSLGGMAILLPLMFIFNFDHWLPQTWSQIGWLIIYGAVMQCFAWGMIAYSIPLLSLGLAGLLLLAEPVAALIIDFTFLHKNINVIQWCGATLTLLAIYWGSVSGKKA